MHKQNNSPVSLELPKLPSLTTLRISLLILLFGSAGAFWIPFSLSLNFSGKMASDGPSSEVKASADSIVSKIATENKLLKLGDSLFDFDLPNITADIDITQARLASIKDQLSTASAECSQVKGILDQNLEHAKQSFSLKEIAFRLETISQLNLLSARKELDELNREIAVHQQRCNEEKKRLVGERNIFEKELDKQISINALTEVIYAPANGYLHRVTVKTGQQISAGQTLGLFTSEGTAGANLLIPLRDRPFVKIGDQYLITSDAYQILNNPPIRPCIISAISPDSFNQNQDSDVNNDNLVYQAQCQFEESPLTGDYPFLVGMGVNGSAASVKATLVQILFEGYRRLLTKQTNENNGSSITNKNL